MKMRVINNLGFLALLATLIFSVQNASATTVPILPESSHYQGSIYYGADGEYDGLYGRIDFAVYDTSVYPNEFIGNDRFDAPGQGQYIYAYQIFNDEDSSSLKVDYFGIFGIDGHTLNESLLYGIGSQSDSPDDTTEEGVEPSSADFDDTDSRVVWEFHDGYLLLDEHSFFLVYSSDYDWVAGSYEFRPKPEFPVDGTPADDDQGVHTPEPISILLFGLSAAVLFAKRRKSL